MEKVLLCFSEVFHSYCIDSDCKAYVKCVYEAGRTAMENSKGRDECAHEVQKAIRTAVTNGIDTKTGFHHVLTEIALLQLRLQADPDSWNVLLVDLHRTDAIFDALPFLRRTQPYLVQMPESAVEFDPSETTHQLFFNILGRIYGLSAPPLLKILQQRYKVHLQELATMRLFFPWSAVTFRARVSKKIAEDLEKDGIYSSKQSHPNLDNPVYRQKSPKILARRIQVFSKAQNTKHGYTTVGCGQGN